MGRLATMPQALALHNAFTLMELALIIAIIGILAAFAVTQSMRMTDGAEEAMLENYYQRLKQGYVHYTVTMGKRPQRFDDFVVSSRIFLDPSIGRTVTILLDKDNMPACWYNLPDPNAGDNTLSCIAGNAYTTATLRRMYIFSFRDGLIIRKKMRYSLS
jgi:type II secretory pathway pseudopilin PulG